MTPDYCTDSDPNTICHTLEEKAPWLALHFPSSVKVKRVEIKNRVDCCGDRMRNVEVRVTDSLPTTGDAMFTGGELLGTFTGPASDGQLVEVEGETAIMGQFVLVQMDNGRDVLNLAEVRVFGEGSTTTTTQVATTTTEGRKLVQ